MKTIALFNHKGGVGKTTLIVNIANAMVEMGRSVLIVDADPQCNLTSFYLEEPDLEALLERSDENGSGETLWSAVKPLAEGRGEIIQIPELSIGENLKLLPGDLLLAEYEEVLSEAWVECFARSRRGYNITTALSHVVNACGAKVKADVCLYDVGPTVGALNRAVLLGCDYFITPVAADFFSLRALSTVGKVMARWIDGWKTIREIATKEDKVRLFKGKAAYLGYITSAFEVNAGRNATNPHADWEKKIAPRVRDRLVKDLEAIDPALVPHAGSNAIGGVKHFHSLAPAAQKYRVAIGSLRGLVNSGHYSQVDEAKNEFLQVTKEIIKRAGL